MAWVKVDDAAMDHPKILKLSAEQFRLWMRGLCYCQKHLTDGFIPDQALKPMLAKAGDAKQLCDVQLWEAVTGGFMVHDYLDWNDPRELVQERRTARDAEKVAHRGKMQRWRDAKKAKRDGHCDASQSRHVTGHSDGHGNVTVPLLTTPHHTTPVQEEIHRETERRMTGTGDPTIARRAGDFFDVWSALFSEHRSGATYHGRPHIDYANCCNLVRSFPDERLRDLAVVFLNSNEPFIESSNRSLAVFETRVTWCDEQLRKAESKQRRSA